MTDLYRVRSTVKEFRGHRDVCLNWFMSRRAQPVAPYADLIADYAEIEHEFRCYAEWLVDEMFTEDEANALFAWLQQNREGENAIERIPTPIKAKHEMGYGSIPVGDLEDLLVISKADDWNLPFEALGYYDLRFYERMEGSPQEAT
jgi:hypothetical protein